MSRLKNNKSVREQPNHKHSSITPEADFSKSDSNESSPAKIDVCHSGSLDRHAALLGDTSSRKLSDTLRRAMVVRQLQRNFGNQYVSRLLDHVSRRNSTGIQAKMEVGPAGDKYEREADHVAKQVLGQIKGAGETISSPSQGMAQRQPQEEGEMLHGRHLAQRQVHLEGGGGKPAADHSTHKNFLPTIQRETKRTEKSILTETRDGGLTDERSEKLIGKMAKSQTFSKARDIASEIESESEALVQALPGNQQTQIRNAIKNYVQTSKAINTDARADPDTSSQNVLNLDAALQAILQQIKANDQTNERIVYRSIDYDGDVKTIPYGTRVKVGDYVGDLGFVSTSEHRQFILGKEHQGEVTGLLKLAIYGRSGVPIALHFIEGSQRSYTNPNEKAMYDIYEDKKSELIQVWNKWFGPGARAGQAEILFPRDTVFQVKKIAPPDDDTVSVVLEEFAGPRPASVKNMKFGDPLK